MRFEWRNRSDDSDALIAINESSNAVEEAWEATAPLLQDFLNEMTTLDYQETAGRVDESNQDPESWGELVIARSDAGDVITIDPELYWGRLAFWFRSRGSDPHPWRGRH